ncbi:DUF3530 family protein [Alteromonas sp. 5E99-2]|uniref:DUF3530 family protein n=1 Tax=Alteromonas sp. 5E99-2 TaxID=2817683 RepID=UPI001A99D81A|nr:DUF3530 family protein [Alteromonas sp. 5E99-2]MBO1256643.1 DUF3530 family protein [Alteromonas sp. 5E99-2]
MNFRFLVCVVALILCQHTVLASDIARQFPTHTVNEINLENSATYSIRIDAQRPLTLGLATVFVSPGRGKLSFYSALDLANELAQKGWHVDLVSSSWLSSQPNPKIDLIDKESMKDAATMTDAASMKETETMAMTEKNIQPWMSTLEPDIDFTSLQTQMVSLVNHLNDTTDTNGFRLFIAEGVVAALLLASASDTLVATPDAVALISPFWPQNEINNTIPELTAAYPYPLLDIGFAASNRFALSTINARKTQANVKIKLDYRQRMLPRAQSRTAIDWVGTEIVGWTRSLGW